jgi:murein DD-endopeptidase MepM/ murein hydrolase activator NlpD
MSQQPENQTSSKPNGKPKKKASAQKTGGMIQQVGLNMLMIGLVAFMAYLAWQRFMGDHNSATVSAEINPIGIGKNLQEPPNVDGELLAALGPLAQPPESSDSISRKSTLKTIIPSRPRVNVITYTVETGDNLFLIAQNFGIKPATMLLGNYDALQDNPRLLKPKQVLNILPVDGAYHEWKEGDTLESVAAYYSVEPSAIIEYPGNFIDLTQVSQGKFEVPVGTRLIIPGGFRPIKDWGPPAISRSNPAVARYYGEGACGSIYEGVIGGGTFVWPTTDRNISGFTFDPGVHPAVDIGGAEGNPIYATDSGVVVFAGWSDYGYGYMIVLDHGNGWQSAYAHLSAVGVGCGQSVYQGGQIGALGNTGNSSGPHLHFELSINGAKVNPLDYIQ